MWPRLRPGEQPALNYALRRTPGLSYRLLARDLYPNGAAYFVRGIRPAGPAGPVIVHNNWMRGAEGKRARFEQHGMWFVDDGGGGVLGPDRAEHISRCAIDSPNAEVSI